MKKSLKSLALAIGTALSLGMVGCQPQLPEHEHTYSNEWSKDETHHWKACSGCSELKDNAEHVFGSYVSNGNATSEKDGTKSRSCKYCGYVDTVVDDGSRLNPSDGTSTKKTLYKSDWSGKYNDFYVEFTLCDDGTFSSTQVSSGYYTFTSSGIMEIDDFGYQHMNMESMKVERYGVDYTSEYYSSSSYTFEDERDRLYKFPLLFNEDKSIMYNVGQGSVYRDLETQQKYRKDITTYTVEETYSTGIKYVELIDDFARVYTDSSSYFGLVEESEKDNISFNYIYSRTGPNADSTFSYEVSDFQSKYGTAKITNYDDYSIMTIGSGADKRELKLKRTYKIIYGGSSNASVFSNAEQKSVLDYFSTKSLTPSDYEISYGCRGYETIYTMNESGREKIGHEYCLVGISDSRIYRTTDFDNFKTNYLDKKNLLENVDYKIDSCNGYVIKYNLTQSGMAKYNAE